MNIDLSSLNPVERWVIVERRGGRTYAQLRQDCGLSVERIRQVERAAFDKLRLVPGHDQNMTGGKAMGRLDGDTPIGPGTGPADLARAKAMGRMDGDGDGVAKEIEDPHKRITRLELEIHGLEQANGQLQDERDELLCSYNRAVEVIRHLVQLLSATP